MNTYFDWSRIQEITDLYLVKASSALRAGEFFYPHAFGFLNAVGDHQEENGLHVAVPPMMVKDRAGFDGLLRYVPRSLPDTGRIEAAGFLVLTPRDVMRQFVPVGPATGESRDLVGMLHVEHVYNGARTMLLDRPLEDWKLIASGVVSPMPSCLPNRVYGSNTLGSA